MPIYEYQCQKCGTELEKRQSVTDEPLKICEECGGELQKKISLSGFQFKGAGWYVTDYAGKNGKTAAKSGDSSEKSSSGESTPGTSDASNTKSDTAAAPKAGSSASED